MVFKIRPAVIHNSVPVGPKVTEIEVDDSGKKEPQNESKDQQKAEDKDDKPKEKDRSKPAIRTKLHPSLVEMLEEEYGHENPFIFYPSRRSGSSSSSGPASASSHKYIPQIDQQQRHIELQRVLRKRISKYKPSRSKNSEKDGISKTLAPIIAFGATTLKNTSQSIANQLTASDTSLESAQVTLMTARLFACLLVLVLYPMAGFLLFTLLIGCEIIFSQDPPLE